MLIRKLRFKVATNNSETIDTLRGNTIENRGYLFVYICVDVRMSFCTLTLVYFCVRSVFDPVPNFTKQNPPV